MPNNGFEREVLDRLIKIEAKIESWDKNKEQIYINKQEIMRLQERDDNQQRDIDELRDRNKWMGRTTAGAVISAVISAVITASIALMQMGMGG
ncbi:MAG: hemolysin XhlA family protein [Butyrivibrio sp.]|nr:hemolysin XhlA family protein [Butyrivibrio sp.]